MYDRPLLPNGAGPSPPHPNADCVGGLGWDLKILATSKIVGGHGPIMRRSITGRIGLSRFGHHR